LEVSVYQFLDFKSFEDASLELTRPLTVLIGRNGAGKSNAIEGVELLAQIAHGRSLLDITDFRPGSLGFQVRGGLQACARAGRGVFGFKFQKEVPLGERVQACTYEVHIRPLPDEPHILRERFEVGGAVIFEAEARMADVPRLSVHYSALATGRLEHTESLPAERSVFSQHGLFSPNTLRLEPGVLGAIEYIKQSLRAPLLVEPRPQAMRAYERTRSRVLSLDGANLSGVLYALHRGSTEDQAALTRILERIRQLPETPVEAFDFVVTSLNDVLFGIRQTKDGPLIDARLLSGGTLRCLAILTALETVKAGSLMVIEEFDSGLYPARVKLLADAISEACERRDLKVLVTTHNPATLDGLTREQLEGVVLCFWDRAKESSRLVPLRKVPGADVLLERGHLGDLVTRRVLEQHLMPGFEESQKAKAQDWLNSLP
jgi:predicted ATPase